MSLTVAFWYVVPCWSFLDVLALNSAGWDEGTRWICGMTEDSALAGRWVSLFFQDPFHLLSTGRTHSKKPQSSCNYEVCADIKYDGVLLTKVNLMVMPSQGGKKLNFAYYQREPQFFFSNFKHVFNWNRILPLSPLHFFPLAPPS